MVLAELHQATEGVNAEVPDWTTSIEPFEDTINESERSWRDPSAHKLRVIISNWTTDVVSKNNIIRVSVLREYIYQSKRVLTGASHS